MLQGNDLLNSTAGGPIAMSVALVTRNNPVSLRACLASLRAQSVQPAEVVVSDDSDDALATQTRGVAEEFHCRYQEGPRRGLYANRNFAALQCSGTHIRTMDDDHTFPAGHFEQCLAAVQGDPRVIWTTGETSYIEGKFHDKTETAAQLHPGGVAGPVGNVDDNWAIADGSTIYPRAIFDSGLRMMEEFGYGSSYLEFGAYLYRHGHRSRCVRGAMVEHHARLGTLSRTSHESSFFASLCYNLYFQPSRVLATKYFLSYNLRVPGLLKKLPQLLEKARDRWESIP